MSRLLEMRCDAIPSEAMRVISLYTRKTRSFKVRMPLIDFVAHIDESVLAVLQSASREQFSGMRLQNELKMSSKMTPE